MAKKLPLFVVALVILLIKTTATSVLAACPQGSIPGPNIAGNVSVENLKNIRQNYGSSDCPISTTIILTDTTIEDEQRTKSLLDAARENNLRLTIRIWGAPNAETATRIGTKLSAELGPNNNAIVEFGNEVNLPNEGFASAQDYANSYANFIRSCPNCNHYLPTLGGPPGSESQKTEFASIIYKSLNANGLISKIKGITFNSISSNPQTAISDWLNTLNAWKTVGVDTKNLKYFITELSPDNADINLASKDYFQAIQSALLKLKSEHPEEFSRLEGMTFFLWDSSQQAWLVFLGQNGNLVKKSLGPGTNLDPSDAVNPKFQISAQTGPLKDYPEESKQKCSLATDTGNPSSPRYKKSDGSVENASRANAGLSFAATVPGLSCGQTKSDPISLLEIVGYNPFTPPLCEALNNWTGKVEITGINTPFAKTIADHWAGTFDAEHLSEKEINDLVAKANFKSTIKSAINTAVAKNAQLNIIKLSGVLGKLLPAELKDDLRAKFIDYVKRRGAQSAYNTMEIDGPQGKIKVRDLPSPMTNAGEKWRTYWNKVPFFPNDQTWGEIKFLVCGDKEYRAFPRYQELMRLGLAGNEIFKILTPKDKQDEYFKNNDQLSEPLKFIAKEENEPKSITFSQKPQNISKPVVIVKKTSIFTKVTDFLASLWPKVKSVLAATPAKIFLAENTCQGLNTNLTLNVANNQIDYRVDITNNLGAGDFTVELYRDGTGDGNKLAFLSGPNNIIKGNSLSVGTPNSGANYSENINPIPFDGQDHTYYAKIKYNGQSCESNESIKACAIKNGTPSCGGSIPPPPPEPACDSKTSCCGKETKDCKDPVCEICKLTQSGPPFVSESDQPTSKSVSIGKVNYTFLKPDYQKYANNSGLPNCTAVLPPINLRTECSKNSDCAGWGTDEVCKAGFCATVIDCKITHNRTIQVYNNAPYLYAIWEQAIGGQSPDQTFVNGFLNQFRPGELIVAKQEDIEKLKKAPGFTDVGCSAEFNQVFRYDPNSNSWVFRTTPGATEVKYKFTLTSVEGGIKDVEMTSPPNQKLLFYRLGGVCNANKWVSEKILNPVMNNP